MDYVKAIDSVLALEDKDNNYTEQSLNKMKVSEKESSDMLYSFIYNSNVMDFFPLIEEFISKANLEEYEEDPKSVVYLAMCALAITHDIPKPTYRKLFSELRLRNIYGFLEDLTFLFTSLLFLHNNILELLKMDKLSSNKEIFTHPLAKEINDAVIKSLDMPLDEVSLYDEQGVAVNNDLINKIVEELAKTHKTLKSHKNIKAVEPSNDGDTVLTWSQWKDRHGLEEINEVQ